MAAISLPSLEEDGGWIDGGWKWEEDVKNLLFFVTSEVAMKWGVCLRSCRLLVFSPTDRERVRGAAASGRCIIPETRSGFVFFFRVMGDTLALSRIPLDAMERKGETKRQGKNAVANSIVLSDAFRGREK